MKKIGLIVALALIVAIGGAYATWSYTQATDVASAEGTATLSITDKEVKTVDGGTITVDASGVTISVDDIGDGTHKAKLVIEGSIIVKFTPSASDTTGTKGLALKCVPSIEGINSFGTPAQTIFTLKSTELTSTGEVGDAETYVEGGNYAYWTIDPADIIQLNEDGVYAKDVDTYEALAAAVKATTLKITASPATTVDP